MPTDSRFWKVFTQISSFIVVMGFIKLVVFYKAFGIPAQYFTNVSELGILVSDNLIYITLIIALAILLSEISLHYRRKAEKEEEESLDDKNDENIVKIIQEKRKMNSKRRYNITLFLICILSPLLGLLNYLFFQSYENLLIFISILISTAPILILHLFTDFTFTHIESTEMLKVTMSLLFALSIMCVITTGEIKQIKKGKYKGTVINLTDSTSIPTSDSVVFVGKTENYVFLYNLNSKTSEIYPTSEVKKITLKQN